MIFHHIRILAIFDLAFRLKFSALLLQFKIMTDLVILSELIKNESARCHIDDIDRLFDRTDFGNLFESVLVRPAIPYHPLAIALCFNLLGVKTINAPARTGTDVTTFARRYAQRLTTTLRPDIAPSRYRAFNIAMERVRALKQRTVSKLHIPENTCSYERVARPAMLVIRDLLARAENDTNVYTPKRKRKHTLTQISTRGIHLPIN